ncbi:MAG TPA: M18 family aminopeptidase [Candidatus Ozemobacteraceae bacterium]|nr:M18 family aminopeptidase [Candidatus Ozemobacteraceae bacterium]
MTTKNAFAGDLIDFIDASPTAFHAVETAVRRLNKAGFTELAEGDAWKLKNGCKYYIIRNKSALLAFVVGRGNPSETGFRMVGTHTDTPCFRVKPSPEMTAEDAYIKLNTEVYGGPILSTWMDRPLSLAGRVALAGRGPLQPKTVLVDFRRPVAIIPNLAIHMNREVNDGVKLNRQVDMLPLMGQTGAKFDKKGFFVKLLAKELKVKPADILDYDLFLYEPGVGCFVGLGQEFISAPRLDNLASTHAALEALISAGAGKATTVMAAFDNEEVGSSTKQGADSQMLAMLLERISTSLGGDREAFFRAVSQSFLISADAAHAVHPNKGEKCDPTNRPMLNRGPAIKVAASQSYTTDAPSAAIFESLCHAANVPVQRFLNRSDERGGSTIGPISSTHLDTRAVDVGIPLLSMHSVRELAGACDPEYLMKAIREFYRA